MNIKSHVTGTCRVDLTEVYGEECWVELKDSNVEQTLCIKECKDDVKAQLKVFKEIFPSILTDHNLDDDGRKLSNEEVADFLWESPWSFQLLYGEWLQWLFRLTGGHRDNS